MDGANVSQFPSSKDRVKWMELKYPNSQVVKIGLNGWS